MKNHFVVPGGILPFAPLPESSAEPLDEPLAELLAEPLAEPLAESAVEPFDELFDALLAAISLGLGCTGVNAAAGAAAFWRKSGLAAAGAADFWRKSGAGAGGGTLSGGLGVSALLS